MNANFKATGAANAATPVAPNEKVIDKLVEDFKTAARSHPTAANGYNLKIWDNLRAQLRAALSHPAPVAAPAAREAIEAACFRWLLENRISEDGNGWLQITYGTARQGEHHPEESRAHWLTTDIAGEMGLEVDDPLAAPAPASKETLVLVGAGALQMVVNALRRDAEEGKKSRGEMADSLLATAQPAPASEAAKQDWKLQAIKDAKPYCLSCEVEGHRTHECWSTHGFNTPRDMEMARLSWIASRQLPLSTSTGDSADAPVQQAGDEGHFTTPYPDLNDLLSETYWMGNGASMDGALLWLEALEKVIAALKGEQPAQPSGSERGEV